MCSNPTIKVHTVVSGETFGADQVLLRRVSNGFRLKRTNRQESDVTILFCPICSRVGSDVEAAISMVSGENKVILVLMHHTRDPNYSTAGTKWSDIFPNVISDVHVLYHESVPGLLMCSQNTDTVYQLQEVLKCYGTHRDNSKIWKIVCLFGFLLVFVLLLTFFGIALKKAQN